MDSSLQGFNWVMITSPRYVSVLRSDTITESFKYLGNQWDYKLTVNIMIRSMAAVDGCMI